MAVTTQKPQSPALSAFGTTPDEAYASLFANQKYKAYDPKFEAPKPELEPRPPATAQYMGQGAYGPSLLPMGKAWLTPEQQAQMEQQRQQQAAAAKPGAAQTIGKPVASAAAANVVTDGIGGAISGTPSAVGLPANSLPSVAAESMPAAGAELVGDAPAVTGVEGGSYLGPAAAVVAGGLQTYGNYNNLKDDPSAQRGAELGVKDPKNWGLYGQVSDYTQSAPFAAINASAASPLLNVLPGAPILLGAAGAVMRNTGSGKDASQKQRDDIRGRLQEAGVIDENYNLTLADGSKYDIGKDGFDFDKNAFPFQVDFANPFAGEAVALANGVAAVMTGGDPEQTKNMAGYLTNAALSNAKTVEDVHQNLRAITASMGLRRAEMVEVINSLPIDDKLKAPYIAGIDRLALRQDAYAPAAPLVGTSQTGAPLNPDLLRAPTQIKTNGQATTINLNPNAATPPRTTAPTINTNPFVNKV